MSQWGPNFSQPGLVACRPVHQGRCKADTASFKQSSEHITVHFAVMITRKHGSAKSIDLRNQAAFEGARSLAVDMYLHAIFRPRRLFSSCALSTARAHIATCSCALPCEHRTTPAVVGSFRTCTIYGSFAILERRCGQIGMHWEQRRPAPHLTAASIACCQNSGSDDSDTTRVWLGLDISTQLTNPRRRGRDS